MSSLERRQPVLPRVVVLLFGLLLLVIGMLCLALGRGSTNLLDVLVAVFSGVGASVVATALLSFILPTKNIPDTLGEQLDALTVDMLLEASRVYRLRQSVDIMIDVVDTKIRITKLHKFGLYNNSGRTISRELDMFTDSADWGQGTNDNQRGFRLVVEPDGTRLDGPELTNMCLPDDDGKSHFKKHYNLTSGDCGDWEFHSIEYYRQLDRIVWTVQEISDDFRVRVVNRTGLDRKIVVKTNHHRARQIPIHRGRNTDGHHVTEFNFGAELLPYQGFELMWRLEE